MKPQTKQILIGVGVGLAVVGTLLFILRKKLGGRTRLLSSTKPLVCAHIGNQDHPNSTKAQNSLKNVELNLENNVDMIELDVQITKDNVPVLFHDNTLDERTNGSGRIQDKTWSELSGVRYNSDSTQGITRLGDVIGGLKKSRKPSILQLDKCDVNEIQKINELGYFKGVEGQILCKGQSFDVPDQVRDAGVMWMPIIPTSYVGKMNNMNTIEEIVEKTKGCDFLEAQFSDNDTLLIDGTLSKKLKNIGCRLLVVAVGGSQSTNGASFRGDNEKAWAKMINPMNAGAIMTNYPLKLKSYINQNT
jgi:hypothetical protein